MKTLTLIRHSRPDIATGICYGHLNIDVAESFAVEVTEIKGWLESVDLLISSPLLRAKRLAEYLKQEFDCEWREDERLQEMNFGEWEGRAWSDIARGELDAWSADMPNFAPPRGESAQQLMQRIQSLLTELARLPQRHIVIVAHGGSLRAMLAILGGVALQEVMAWQIGFGAVINIRLAKLRGGRSV